MADIARIEDRIDRVAASTLEVSDALGGLRFQNMVEVMEFAKCMAIADTAVPKHLRGNVGMCLAVCVQALEWRFSPFAVANKSYVVNDRIGYESQLVHAVIEQRAPIIGRLRHTFSGEGEDRRCIVTATLRETGETLEYISPPFSKIQPKNSPLWKTKPDLQLYYNTSRDFCRAYFPDVLLGVYSQEELRDHLGPDNAKPIGDKPSVGDRLKGNKGRGFNASHVERETRGVVEEPITTGDAGHSKPLHDVTRHEKQVDPQAGATDAPRHPDRTETVGEAEHGGGHEVTAAGAAPDTSAPRDSNSSGVPQGQTDTPAAEIPPEAAGTQSELSAESATVGDGEARDGVSGGGAVSQPTLPEGWGISYAGALRRAQKPDSLPKYATEFWNQYGGWTAHKNGDNGPTAEAIYDAFAKNFGNKEATEDALRELL